MLAYFPLLFSFPFLVDDLNFMWGKSSMGVSRTFVLGAFPLPTVVWKGFIELPVSKENLDSSTASPSLCGSGTYSYSFNFANFKKKSRAFPAPLE